MSIKSLFQKILGEDEGQISSGYYEVGNSASGSDNSNTRKVSVNVLNEEGKKDTSAESVAQPVSESPNDLTGKTDIASEIKQEQSQGEPEISMVKIGIKSENDTPSPFLEPVKTMQEDTTMIADAKTEEVKSGSSVIKENVPADEAVEVVATGASLKTEKNGPHFALEKKFAKAIGLIEEIKKEDFFTRYSKELDPIYEGDYRKMLNEMMDHIAEHPVDKFPPELMKRFRDAEKLVQDLGKEDHDSKLVVSEGKTYLVKKDSKNGEQNEEQGFELQLEERSYILSHLPVIESFIEEEIKGMELEKSYLADLLGDFKKLKTISLLAIGIKDHFKCSDEDAARIAKDIVQRSEKKTRKK